MPFAIPWKCCRRSKRFLQDFESAAADRSCRRIWIRLEDLYELIDAAIMEEPPISIRDGGIIKDGYNEEVDHTAEAPRRKERNGWRSWRAKEREKTGIKNLKIKYNKVFGYYLEVTNSYKDLVPDDYIRKQTLTNAERYITPELKELEDTILGAEDKLIALEYDLFCEVRDTIAA